MAVPNLTTTTTLGITTSTAISGGTISIDGGASITAKGVCWSTSTMPTIDLATKTNNGAGTATFTSSLSGLAPVTTYYVRAYATNSFGTGYGQEQVFKTLVALPTLTTTATTAITIAAASSGGTISSDGGASITAKGVCWSTSTMPIIDLATKTNDGTGAATFTSSLSGLAPGTTYYVRAYATNIGGTAYGAEVSFTTTVATITNGTQFWQNTNLNVATYSDSTPIPQVTDPTAWANLTTGAWCYYNNDIATGTTYGKLYNWYAVAGIWNEASKTDVSQRKKLAPTGYHIPSDAEWTTLTDYLGGAAVAGGKMKEIGYSHWLSSNSGVTNSSDFSGLPGGCRYGDGTFLAIGYYGYWWSSSELDSTKAWGRYLLYVYVNASREGQDKRSGYSVRCLRD